MSRIASAPIARGLVHLYLVDREVLAKNGKGRRIARRGQVVDPTAEGGPVGQDRQRPGAARLVRLGRGAGIEVGGEVALRGRTALDLADHGDPPVGAPQRAGEIASRRRVERVLPEEIARLRPAQHGDLVALAGEYLVEDGHSVGGVYGLGWPRPAEIGFALMSATLPDGFLWGVAAAAHQIEGGNWNNDWWAWEHAPNSPCIEVSGDCCDSYHRFADDIALVRDLGFPSYRFSIEWSRIEPEDGEFSRAALDYYRRATHHVPRQRRRSPRDVPSLHDAALDGRPGGLDRSVDRRQVHSLLREGGRAPRRPHGDGLHDQRAQRRVDARLPHGALPARRA